jgi:hypothetical protein
MRNALVGGMLVVLAALAAACSGRFNVNAPTVGSGSPFGGNTTREALWDKDLALKEEAVMALAPANNQQDLNFARQKLAGLVEKHKANKQEYQKLGPATAQEAKAIREKFEGRTKNVRENLAREMNRVNQIPGGGDAYRMGVELLTDLN